MLSKKNITFVVELDRRAIKALIYKSVAAMRVADALSFLILDGWGTSPEEGPQNNYLIPMKPGALIIGILVLGTNARRVRVHSYWRVRRGKKEHVKAHWRTLWR